MKLLIDLQSLQTGSAERGIGRYSRALTLALIAELEGHEIFILLNDSQQSIQESAVTRDIERIIGKGRIIRFPLATISTPAIELKSNEVQFSKIIRERLIEAVNPDVVLITSLFEFDALSTIPKASNRSYFCATILYDLIPLSQPEQYLPNLKLLDWYQDRLEQLKQADAVLAISNYTKQDALVKINLQDTLVENISGGSDLIKMTFAEEEHEVYRNTLSEIGPYILYVGGFDSRKNVESLIKTFATLPKENYGIYKLILAGNLSDSRRQELEKCIASVGLMGDEVILYGYVEDKFLFELYKNAYLFVFPSVDEGLGLPPLEAMSFGVPTIASNCASLPEVVGNMNALFNPHNKDEFLEMLKLGLDNSSYRSSLKLHGLKQSSLFSWKNSAKIAINFIIERYTGFSAGRRDEYLSFNDFLVKTSKSNGITLNKDEPMKLTNLLARALLGASKAKDKKIITELPKELKMPEAFSCSVPDYAEMNKPYVFSSTLCRQQHFYLPLYTFWCKTLCKLPRFHRKQWEFIYICQTLFERGYLREGLSAIGFGVGKEPLVSYFASVGIKVLATDLELLEAQKIGWVSSGQHSSAIDMLNERGICNPNDFDRLTDFRFVDMNKIPKDIGVYDICWSSCAFEHLGSIRQGLDFVLNSARLLKPGGIAVHTTEFNLSSNSRTLDNNPAFVIFRRCDIELLVKELESEGYHVSPIDFSAGGDELERYIDLPPYIDEPHLRLELAGEFVSTSLGIIVMAPTDKK